jgi:hypothetical protein
VASGAASVCHGSADREGRRIWWFFGIDCVLAVSLRLGLAWFTGGYTTDQLTF